MRLLLKTTSGTYAPIAAVPKEPPMRPGKMDVVNLRAACTIINSVDMLETTTTLAEIVMRKSTSLRAKDPALPNVALLVERTVGITALIKPKE